MKTFNQFLGEATTSSFEIIDTKNMSVKEAEKSISANYPDNLTYKGIEFFDKVYMDAIMKEARAELDPSGQGSGQESYLGYLPKEDLFISGWDTWSGDEDEEDYSGSEPTNSFSGNLAFVKVNERGVATVAKISGDAGDMMYGRGGSLSQLEKKYPNLVNIRLD